ncbi:MAG: cupin domain-containing protein [Spirosomataceae bacterium]
MSTYYQSPMNASTLIEQLNLQAHPEGGYYQETYRCKNSLKVTENAERSISTAIYFLLKDQDKSHFHRIKSDELWFFHLGQSLEILLLENGTLRTITLGSNLLAGETLQAVVPANTWFASRLKDGYGFGLVSCTVAPGFDFQDFELATKSSLLAAYPHLSEVIQEMTLND